MLSSHIACLATAAVLALSRSVLAQHLLFVPELPSTRPTCAGYRGRYEAHHVFHVPETCSLTFVGELDAGAITVIANDDIVLHVRPADLDPQVFPDYEPTDVLRDLETRLAEYAWSHPTGPGRQYPFRPRPTAHLLHDTPSSAFYSIPVSALQTYIDLLTDQPYLELTLVSPHDLPLDRSKLDEDRQRVQEVIDGLSYQSIIGEISGAVKEKGLRDVVRHLTGEDGRASWETRHSFTEGAVKVAHWLKAQYEATGLQCRLFDYFTGFSPDVICTSKPLITAPYKNATDLPIVVIGAHYDDRGSFGYVRAPGGDDDGSGSSMLLNIARILHSYRVRFKDVEVILAAFSGEEQGLWGSRYFAKELRDQGRDVILMLQADMIAYRKPGEPVQLAFPDVHSIPEGRWLVGNVSRLYTPELVTGITPACCSDSQAFDDQGFASSWVFERNGPIADPKYHNSCVYLSYATYFALSAWDSGDLSDRKGYDLEQMRLITSTVLATLLTLVPFRV